MTLESVFRSVTLRCMTIKKQKLKKCIQHVGKVDECLGKVLSNARLAFKETCAALDEWSKNGPKSVKNGTEGQTVSKEGEQKVLGKIAKAKQALDELEKEVIGRTDAWNKPAKPGKRQKSLLTEKPEKC